MISRFSSISAAALLLASAGAAAAFPATVTTDLNVRSGPGTGYSVVDNLQAGDTVEVVQSSGSWFQLAEGGWASANFLDADGSAAVDQSYADPGYAVVDSYPSYYGSPAFYYGSDPFFWDDGGYYWYWRGGSRHRVSHDWWRGRDHRDFRWSNDNYRRDWQRRIGGGNASIGNDGPRRNFGNDGQPRSRNMGGNGPRRNFNAEGQSNIRTGRASVEGGPRFQGRGIEGGGRGIEGGRGGGDMRGGGGAGRGGAGRGGGGGGYGGGGGLGGGGGQFHR
jgi:uncharacterized protein YraI